MAVSRASRRWGRASAAFDTSPVASWPTAAHSVAISRLQRKGTVWLLWRASAEAAQARHCRGPA
eukprot:1313033-Lingulodinium_polyedra.AAC.1